MDIHASLQWLDFTVILLYIIALISIGMIVSYQRRDQTDLFLAGRSLGWHNVGLSIFGTNISPSFLIASCSAAYTSGIVTANFEWLAWIFLLLLGMLFVPHYMNTKISTMPQFVRLRFGPGAYRFLSWYALFSTIILWLGGSLYAGGVLLSQIMAWPLWLSVVVLVVIATSFTVAGGLAAVVITDSFQSVLMIAGSATMTFIAFHHLGDMDRLVQGVPADFWRLVRPAGDNAFPWPAMFLGYPVLGIWFWCTDQTIVQRVLGAKNLRQGQLGTVFAGFLKILPPFIFMFPGLLCYVLHPNIGDPDAAYMTMVTRYLPVGMVGLVVAVLIAAVISTLDSGLNSFSTVFTLDIYVKHFRPQATDVEIKWLGRVVTLFASALAVGCALLMGGVGKNMFDLLQGIISFLAPPMASVFLIGILWKRATATAALTSLIGGSILSLSIGVCYFKEWPYAGFWPHYLMSAFYLFVLISATMFVVSLLTKKSPHEQELPGLKKSAKTMSKAFPLVWLLWAILAICMLILYIVFN
ncbi:sodium/solute symporter [candidate division KSB1 bacterium]|nr:sodium/solute symporter [candidate division KSB1 bacterium]